MPTPSEQRPSAEGHAAADRQRGREACAREAWATAFEALSRADRQSPLGADDLERLAQAAYLTGRDDEYLSALQRAHRAHLRAGARASAARDAFWIALRMLLRGESAQASGWLARAGRMLEGEPSECSARGYLLLASAQLKLDAGELTAAHDSALAATRIGERCGELDLMVIARHVLGLVRLQQGQVRAGLSLLDETMVAAAGGELSPIVTGLMYCSVIGGCHRVYALERAREWTRALASWCARQPEMVAFAGICSVHRAEILLLEGAWPEALSEAERAISRCLGVHRAATGAAYYQRAELRRLRGDLAAAEEAYRDASLHGYEPQPGLALLRLAQGQTDAAAQAIRRALASATELDQRARLLPAGVEILLAAGDTEGAERAERELGELAERLESRTLSAEAAQARGAVELAQGDATAALPLLRLAAATWQELEMPYLAARARVLIARCCRALRDLDGERLEIAAARAVFEQLAAKSELGSLLCPSPPPPRPHTLTARELQVLRLLAGGDTNKAIAASLGLSEKTIERHLSHIFGKLHVESRTAAAAYAYAHRLV